MRVSETELTPFGELLLDQSVNSVLGFKAPLIFRLANELWSRGLVSTADRNATELCLDEAITNAMVHGNRLNPEKKIRARLFADATRWGLLLSDEGDGFDAKSIRTGDSEEDLMKESGRGIPILEHYLDELVYSAKGTEVLLLRKRGADVPVPAPAPELEGAEHAVPLEFPLSAIEAAAPTRSAPTAVARTELVDGIAVVEVLAPRLSDDNLAGLRGCFDEALARSASLVLDLAAVEYMSSIVIGAFVAYYNRQQFGYLESLLRSQIISSADDISFDSFNVFGLQRIFE
ncbi:MAG: ATP-binding protein [Planctomycetes bacterium]|nr:ATP-binding protein [Planctomycetota bacterium]